MKNIKASIHDYIEEFRMKTPEEKKQALRKLGTDLGVAAIFICSPFLITHADKSLEKDLRSRKNLELSDDAKWQLLHTGRMRLECEDNANQEVRKVGLDISTHEGMEYAVENNLCDFALNQ